MELIIIWIFFAAVCGFIGYSLGEMNGKQNGAMGGLLGALFGPLGCLVAAVLPPAQDQGEAKPATPNTDRIAVLEAELLKLKQGASVKTPARLAVKDLTGDDAIPTYKLD